MPLKTTAEAREERRQEILAYCSPIEPGSQAEFELSLLDDIETLLKDAGVRD